MKTTKWMVLLTCAAMLAGCTQAVKAPASSEASSAAQDTPFLATSPPKMIQTPTIVPVTPSPGAIPSSTVKPPAVGDLYAPPSPYEDSKLHNDPATLKEQLKVLRLRNDEAIGWLIVPNTNIDYPIVMALDNEFYLTHNLNKEKSKNGALFLDFRNADPMRQQHLIIYGRNIRNGTMFRDLYNYKEKEFFERNGAITFLYSDEISKWRVFSAHTYDVTKSNLTATEFGSGKMFKEYMRGVKELSEFQNNVEIGEEDQVLTLLTGAEEGNAYRYVVSFKRMKE